LNQPVEEVMRIKIFSGVIPGAACLLGTLLLSWSPLRVEGLIEVQQKVLVLHKKKKQKFEEGMNGEGESIDEKRRKKGFVEY